MDHLLSAGWVFYVPLVFAGFDPRMVDTLLAFDLRYQFFLHTEAVGRLGMLEWVLNTPAHHRVHHGSDAPYRDRNYGRVAIVFDRMFGTFAEEREDDPVPYGLVGEQRGRNSIMIALAGWNDLARITARSSRPLHTMIGAPR